MASSKTEIQNGCGAIAEQEENNIVADGPSDIRDEDSTCTSPTDEKHEGQRAREGSEDFKSRLRKELMSRDGHKELGKQTKLLTLAFSDDCERAYHQHAESFSSVTLQAFLVVRLAIGSAEFVVLPRRMMNFASFAIGNFLLMIISTISLADVLPSMCPSRLINFFKWINESMWLRRIFATLTILLLASANIVDMVRLSSWFCRMT